MGFVFQDFSEKEIRKNGELGDAKSAKSKSK